MKKTNGINQLIKRLFPLPARLKIAGSTEDRRHARILSVMLLTISATVWFWTVSLMLIFVFYHFDILPNVYFSLFISTLLGLQVFAFFRSGNLRLTTMLFTLTYFLMVLSLVLISGGYHSPNLVVLLTSPVISFRAGGKEEGIMNSIFVGLTAFALVVMDYLDVSVLNLLSGLDERIFFTVAWTVTLAIMATCLVTYDMDE